MVLARDESSVWDRWEMGLLVEQDEIVAGRLKRAGMGTVSPTGRRASEIRWKFTVPRLRETRAECLASPEVWSVETDWQVNVGPFRSRSGSSTTWYGLTTMFSPLPGNCSDGLRQKEEKRHLSLGTVIMAPVHSRSNCGNPVRQDSMFPL